MAKWVRYNCTPIGLTAISSFITSDVGTLKQSCYLIFTGWLKSTNKGITLTMVTTFCKGCLFMPQEHLIESLSSL